MYDGRREVHLKENTPCYIKTFYCYPKPGQIKSSLVARRIRCGVTFVLSLLIAEAVSTEKMELCYEEFLIDC